jgi:hypothetical protein
MAIFLWVLLALFVWSIRGWITILFLVIISTETGRFIIGAVLIIILISWLFGC